MTDPLVTVAWLADHMGDPALVVLDATKYLPTEGKDGLAEFTRAHIPGARFFNLDEVADQDTHLPHMVPAAGRFEALMGRLGVSNASTVVFYDQKGIASAPRGWWMLGLFGHDDAYVLDGGLPAWLRCARLTEAGATVPPSAPATFRASLRATRLRGIGDMLDLPPRTLVLDARPPGRFDGSAPEPRPGLPSGHMPGSLNLPYAALLNPDGTMLDADALRTTLVGMGADGTRPVVTTCGTGVTATILTLALRRAGLPEGAVYDGSWTEWASRLDTPKETTDAR